MSLAKEICLPAPRTFAMLAAGLWLALAGCNALNNADGTGRGALYQDSGEPLVDGSEALRLHFWQSLASEASDGVDAGPREMAQRLFAVSGRGEYWVFWPSQRHGRWGEVMGGTLSALEVEELRRDLRWGEIDARAALRQDVNCRAPAGHLSNGTSSYELCLSHPPFAEADEAIVQAIDGWMERLIAQGSPARHTAWQGRLVAIGDSAPEGNAALPLPEALQAWASAQREDGRAASFPDELQAELRALRQRMRRGEEADPASEFIPLADAGGQRYRLYLWPALPRPPAEAAAAGAPP